MLIGIEAEALKSLLFEVVETALNKRDGLPVASDENLPTPTSFISTVAFKKFLTQRGYACKSSSTIKTIAIDHSVTFQKRGRELWFNSKEAYNNIPSKL